MKREKIIGDALELINGDRAEKYGPALATHKRIAAGWSVIFGVEIKPYHVALAMIWLKVCRLIHANDDDSWKDIVGYGGIGGEIADEE